MKYSLFSLGILLFSFIIPNKNLRSCLFTLFAGPSWTFRSCTLLWRRILQNNNQLCYYCWRGKNVFLLNLFETRPIRRASTLIRSLSTNDCDGYENFAWKVKSLYFKLHRAYFICCFSFANLNLLLFCRSRWRRRRRCLSSLISREPWKNLTFRPCSPSCLFCDYDKW